jgi:hypothetical protein
MKIKFVESVPEKSKCVFINYRYEDKDSDSVWCVDLRKILRREWSRWAISLSTEHKTIENYFSELYGWRWFASDAMRPNVLPWGDQSIFKPYFFVKAACPTFKGFILFAPYTFDL